MNNFKSHIQFGEFGESSFLLILPVPTPLKVHATVLQRSSVAGPVLSIWGEQSIALADRSPKRVRRERLIAGL